MPSKVKRWVTESGMLMVKSPEIMVGRMLCTLSTAIPAPRSVTALVMFTGLKEPEERVMTSPCTAATCASLNADAP